MDERRNDGGPAFPDPVAVGPSGYVYPSNSAGMSLRDWFAGQVLAGHAYTIHSVQAHSRVATKAYAIADAMLKARK